MGKAIEVESLETTSDEAEELAKIVSSKPRFPHLLEEQNVVCSQRHIPPVLKRGLKRSLRSEETLVELDLIDTGDTTSRRPPQGTPRKRTRMGHTEASPSPPPTAEHSLAALRTRAYELQLELDATLDAIAEIEDTSTADELEPANDKVQHDFRQRKPCLDPRQLLIWLDLETTDAERKYEEMRILEIGVRITDGQLVSLDKGICFLIHYPDWDETLSLMCKVTKNMHTNSNLMGDLTDDSKPKLSLPEAEQKVCDYLRKYGILKDGVLAGVGVHYDRNTIRYHMPHLNKMLDYSVLDTSTLWRIVKVRFNKSRRYKENDRAEHRAMDDVNWGIRELRLYYDVLIRDEIEWPY